MSKTKQKAEKPREVSIEGGTLRCAHAHASGGQVSHRLASLWGSADDRSEWSGIRFRVTIDLRDTKQSTGGFAKVEAWIDGWREVATVEHDEVRQPEHNGDGPKGYKIDLDLLHEVEVMLLRRAAYVMGLTCSVDSEDE